MNIEDKIKTIRDLLINKEGVCRLSVLTDLAGLDKDMFIGAVLSGIKSDGPDDLSCYDFENADLSKANLQGCDLTGANFTGANLTSANLQSAILVDAIFTNAIMTNTNFINAKF